MGYSHKLDDPPNAIPHTVCHILWVSARLRLNSRSFWAFWILGRRWFVKLNMISVVSCFAVWISRATISFCSRMTCASLLTEGSKRYLLIQQNHRFELHSLCFYYSIEILELRAMRFIILVNDFFHHVSRQVRSLSNAFAAQIRSIIFVSAKTLRMRGNRA